MKKAILFSILTLLICSSISAQVGVTSQQKRDNSYQLVITDYLHKVNVDDKVCEGYSELFITGNTNIEQSVMYIPLPEGHANESATFSEKKILVNSLKSMRLYQFVHDAEQGLFSETCSDGTEGKGYTTLSTSICSINSFSKEFLARDINTNRVTFNYRLIPLHTLDVETVNGLSNGYLPIEDKVRLHAKEGFSSYLYRYQYRLQGEYTWKDVPGNLYSSDILTVSAKDLFGDDYINHLGKRVEFRVVSCPDGTDYLSYSDIVPLTIIKSAPHIVNTVPAAVKCFGQANGEIKVFLDRPLESGEQLAIYGGPQRLDISSLESDNSFTMAGLTAGYYTVQISGSYNGGQMYSDGQNHKKNVTVTSPPVLTYALTASTNISCFGESNGTVSLSASGGVGGYRVYYKESKDSGYRSPLTFISSTGTTISSLPAGIYDFYVVDANGCEIRNIDGTIKTIQVTLTQPAKALTFAFLPSLQPSGYGRNDGKSILEGDGGTPFAGNSYTATWKNKQTGQVITTVLNEPMGAKFRTTATVPAGTYTVEIKDANNCTYTAEATIEQPKELTLSLDNPMAILCNGETTGKLIAHARGGVRADGEQYSYQWYKNGTPYTAVSPTDSIASNLGAGTYRLVVSDRSRVANTIEKEFILSEPAILTATVSKQDVTCYGGNNGSIQVNITGGSGGNKLYYKLKSDAAYMTPVSVQGNTYTLGGLIAGQYQIYITDTNNCTASFAGQSLTEVTIAQPSQALEISSSTVKPVSGFGLSNGSIELKIKGGTPNAAMPYYTVTWKNAAGTAVTSTQSLDANSVFTSKTENLPEGIYTVEIRDKNYAGTANACYVASSFTVVQPGLLTVKTENTNGVYCYGETTGILVAHAKGGVQGNFSGLPYNYKWYKVANGTATLLSSQADSIAENLPAGTYKVRIEDAANPVNSVESPTFEITQPALLKTTPATRNIACYGENTGFIHIGVSGGAGNYKLFCKQEGIDADYKEQAINTGDNTFYLDNLYSGTYSIYIQDANGCYAQINGEDIHMITLTQPAAPLAIEDAVQTDVSGYGRSDGSVTVKVTGGSMNTAVPHYAVTWKNAAGTLLASTDSFDAYGVFTSKLSNIPEGVYTIEVKDKNYNGAANTCYVTSAFTVIQPDPLVVELENTNGIYCYGEETGELVAHAKGGIANTQTIYPYSYTWYSITDGSASLIPNQTDSILRNRPAGQYRVRIEDFSRVANTVESPVFEIAQPTLLTTILTTRNISCYGLNDGFIRLEVSGGTGDYKLFCKKESDAAYTEYPVATDSKTFLLDNLYTGKYTVYIQDANSCYAKINREDIHQITLSQPSAPLVISAVAQIDASGYGRSDGSIKITIEGGTPNADGSYNVLWKNGTGQTLPATGSVENGKYVSLLNNIPTGSYTVEVKDGNYAGAYPQANASCFVSELYSISQPDRLLTEIEETRVISCNGMSDGQLIAHTTGGIRNPVAGRLPYFYTWYREETGGVYTLLPNETDSILSNIPTGNYKVEIEDYSRVVNTISVGYELVQPDLLQASATEISVTCGQTATVSATVTGGTLPYRYEWSTGDTTQAVAGVSPGRYFVFINDSRGCQTTAVATVSTPGGLDVNGTVSQPVCYGAANGSIGLEVTGGTAPYAYTWNTGATTKDLNNLKAGQYTVVVTDRGGCSFTDSFILSDPEALTVDLGDDRTLCNGQSLTLAPEAVDPATRFSWTGPDAFNAATPEVTVDKAGTYRLVITDSKGCQAADEINVSVKNIDISSEIFVSTEVFTGDTVVIANISNPAPDSVKWLIEDTDSMRVVEMDEFYARVIFYHPGHYTVGFRAHKGDCYEEVRKTINAVSPDQTPGKEFGEAIINKFYVYPNPNDGNFHAIVDLSRVSAIRLRIINVGTGYVASDKKYNGQKEYDLPYILTISPGAYIIVLETSSGYMNVKMIVR